MGTQVDAVATQGLDHGGEASLIDAKGLHYRDLNEQVRAAIAEGCGRIRVTGVRGQRYLGAGLRGDLLIEVEGVPGNDLAAFMDGPRIVVRGNAQDGVCNTMNRGQVVVHGHAGDVLGYGMRGGALFVRGDVGYRVGIHMKEYKGQRPVLVAGGCAGDFLGEYMAGGVLAVLGLGRDARQPLVGDYCGTGMHGGVIFVRGQADPAHIVLDQVALSSASQDDMALLTPYLEAFCQEFGCDVAELMAESFFPLRPVSHRPYGSKYAP